MSEISIETSHNVEINVQMAPLTSRIWAYLIDSLIVGVFLIFVVILLIAATSANQNGENIIVVFVIIFLGVLPMWLYHLLFEIFNHGQSWGKSIMKIRVVKVDGSQPTIGSFILRWLLRPIDLFAYGGVAIVTIALTKRSQRLGDLAADTIVVKLKGKVTLNELTQYLSAEVYTPVFPNTSLLTQAQINVIKDSLTKFKSTGNQQVVRDLAIKVKSILNIESTLFDYQFLHTIVKDYENMNQK
jgi:uncharacterized RDD family membrane protein YckC